MAERSPTREKGEGLVLRDADGALYKVPYDRLKRFRLSEEDSTDLRAKLNWRTEVVGEDPFLFESVELKSEQGGVQMMMPGTGWCACRGKCNCFCGYCSCS
jgi:hypothetical protein